MIFKHKFDNILYISISIIYSEQEIIEYTEFVFKVKNLIHKK